MRRYVRAILGLAGMAGPALMRSGEWRHDASTRSTSTRHPVMTHVALTGCRPAAGARDQPK